MDIFYSWVLAYICPVSETSLKLTPDTCSRIQVSRTSNLYIRIQVDTSGYNSLLHPSSKLHFISFVCIVLSTFMYILGLLHNCISLRFPFCQHLIKHVMMMMMMFFIWWTADDVAKDHHHHHLFVHKKMYIKYTSIKQVNSTTRHWEVL